MGAKASTHEWGPDIKAICAEGEDPDDKQFPREIPRGFVKMEKKIGEGRFGSTAHCQIKDFDGSQGGLAIQAVCKSFSKVPKDQRGSVFRGCAEMVQMNAMVNHVVKVLGIVSSSKGAPILLLEPCDVGPLPAYLAHKIGLGTADKMKILSDISDGMSELEALGFVHGSLTCQNVLVADGGTTFKVSDWGFQNKDIRYLAVEMFEPWDKLKALPKPSKKAAADSSEGEGTGAGAGDEGAGGGGGGDTGDTGGARSSALPARLPLTHAVDVWAFGVLAHEVFADGEPAYSTAWDDHQVRQKIEKGFRPGKPELAPKELYDIMAKCWDSDPRARPDFFWLRGELEDKTIAAQDRQEKKKQQQLKM